MKLLCKRLSPDAKIPVRAHGNDSGADFYALEETSIMPGETALVRTGIAVAVVNEVDSNIVDNNDYMRGYGTTWTYGVFGWDKSGLSSKGLKIGAGVIDNGYRGEIVFVISYLPTVGLWMNLIHMLLKATRLVDIGRALTMKPYVFHKGDKIAQIVVQRVELVVIEEVDQLPDAVRGDAGFGSTGQ